MEYLKTYYSLEKHLEETLKFNPQFEVLNAIWKLNKKNLTSALSNVNQYFPHYSLHERSHSETIISNIELFLGEERIKTLSPTNTWLLLMAAFTHDLGMVVFHELIEKEWTSKNFQNFLKEVSEWDEPEMKSSGELLLKLQEISRTQKFDDSNWLTSLAAIDIKKSVTLIVAEYMRRIHHKRSSEILNGIDKIFYQVANSFYSDQIPGRLLAILADVAYLHGVEFYEIFKRLDFEANGISNDKIHPRFIASMLRLGDLLDIDDSRFNLFTEKVFIMPENSSLHKKKHSSIKHFLITPEAIEITADCPDERVYRLARNWFDWLEGEVENQSREWSNIAPKNLNGSAPRIPKGKIKVFFKGSRGDESLINLKFQISNEKIFEILEGSSIYEHAGFTFIRELVQNALDASKIQLWKEIEKGTYDFAFQEHFKNKNLSHEDIINGILFPNDIPSSLANSFNIKLIFEWKDDSKNILQITVLDKGTGISNSDLIRMTEKVGESRKMNLEYQEMLQRMPFWLKPTGAFGIGLQSVFIVSDSFIVQTKSEGEESKELVFRSAKKGKYSLFTERKPEMGRGTKVVVHIPKEKFSEVFGNSFDWSITMVYDYFSDTHNSIYIPKIKLYVKETLNKIESLNINFFGEDFNSKEESDEFNLVASTKSSETGLFLTLSYKDQELYFNFYENIIGSQFTLIFPSNISTDLDSSVFLRNEYFVRGIPVKSKTSSYYALSFSNLIWNFMSPESDKILNLSRDKFISKWKRLLENEFLDKVIPNAIKLAEKLIIDKKENIKNIFLDNPARLALIYFKLALTKKVNLLKDDHIENDLFLDTDLPIEMLSHFDNSLINMANFFKLNEVAVPIQTNHSGFTNIDAKRQLINLCKIDLINNKVIIWKFEWFAQYFRTNYQISGIEFFDKGNVLLLEKNDQNNENIKVISGENIYLKNFLGEFTSRSREWNYAVEKYAHKLAIFNRYLTGFEHFPLLSSTSIISPFKSYRAYLELKQKVKQQTQKLEIEKIKKILTNDLIKQYATPSLINWIVENRKLGNNPITENEVIDGYRDLITDILIQI